MKAGSGGNLGSSRKYSRKLFAPMFYSWCNCPLMSIPECGREKLLTDGEKIEILLPGLDG